MGDEILTAGGASVWVQPYGPNTKPVYLGCHEVGDLEVEYGELTLIKCPDPAHHKAGIVRGSYRTESNAAPSITLTTLLTKSLDWLERLTCPATVYVHKGECGRRDVFTNWERSFVLSRAGVSGRTYGSLGVRDMNDETPSTLEAPLQAEELILAQETSGALQTIGATENILAVAILDNPQCAGPCGAFVAPCDNAVVVCESNAGSAATPEIYVTADGGATWVATIADPFAAGEDIAAVAYITTDAGGHRIIVARGTADPANPAEIAYSDNGGATWVNVNVGAVNGQYVTDGEALFALDPHNIWLVTTGGYIYYSDDQGDTWATLDAGVTTAEDLNAVEFITADVGYAVGENATVLRTTNGGYSWEAVPALPAGVNDIRALAVPDKTTLWIGDTVGGLWFSHDSGDTWAERALPAPAAIVQDIAFANQLFGFLIYDTAAPVGHVLRTIDGGYTWQPVQIPANAGLNMLALCSPNGFFAVGDVSGGHGVVVKAEA